jgi:hypothetical protein
MANSNAITTKQKDFNNNNSLQNTANKSGEELLASIWGLDQNRLQQVNNISRVYFTKHGMFASIPILCRDKDCAYKDVCMVDPSQRIIGTRCPMEIAALVTRFNQWCQHFDIDISGDTIDSKDLVDATLIKDLVNIEIQILRAENKIALSGDFMGETLLEVDKKCNAYYGTIITPESEFLMTLQDKKMKILNQLNATRKDKAADKRRESASDEAVRIFQQMQELQKQHNKSKFDIMDVEFDENGDIIEESEEIKEEIIDEKEEIDKKEEKIKQKIHEMLEKSKEKAKNEENSQIIEDNSQKEV